ncbi:TolB-like translocation protein [Jatrophihabitans fulvus]
MTTATRTFRSLALASLAATALGAVTLPAASATPVRTTAATRGTSGTIVFVRAHNIWVAKGDGTHAHAVTRSGTAARPYHSPSESDTGIIAAARGTVIVRMTQRGKVLNVIDPPALRNSAGERMDGAVNDVALSPNGRTIAWSFVRYSCPVGADCLVRYATGYTASTRRTHAGRSTYYRQASWVTSGRTLQTGGYGSQVMLQDVTGAPRHWFDDHDYAFPSEDLSDGELSRNGRWLAEVRGDKGSRAIIWYRVGRNARAGSPPAVPTYTCYTNGEAAHASPTWSPDSTALAWAGSGGIWVKRSAGTCSSPAPRLLIRNGSAPDWSPAGLR